MFKRANKITALALAAASVMATVPAMAADTVKLSNKDGHVYEGVSFKDGKYGYYGYRTDDDDKQIWYNNGSKDKDTSIKDTEDYEIDKSTFSQMYAQLTTSEGVKYGSKYVIATEGGNNDEYLIDLSTGKLADIDTPEDQEASAKARLISGLKKAERYNQTSDSAYKINDADVSFQRLFKNKFGDLWYQYVTTSNVASLSNNDGATTTASFGDSTTGAAIYTGFADENGKYIDASYTANLRVYNERKQKASVIEKFGKVYKDEALKLNLKQLKALAQDKDNIYALAQVEVLYYGTDANKNYVYKDDAATTTKTTQYFIQKISKARGDQEEDGAYIPKNVTAWQLDYAKDVASLKNGLGFTNVYESDDDRNDAAKAILSADGTGTDENRAGKNFSVIDGNLYVTTTYKSGNVKVWKLKLKNDKINLAAKSSNDIDGTREEKVDTSVVVKDKKDDMDFDDWTVDTDGNTWVLKDGQIKMFDGSEFVSKYRCDRGFDRLDVYDSGDLIAWDSDNDDDDDNGAYTTVQEGKQQTVTEGQIVDPNLVDKTTAKIGWDQAADGTWNFYDATGAKVVNNWANPGGVWYFLDENGNMVTGWKQVNGTWYYLNPQAGGPMGSMMTGWQQVGGVWYFLESSGAMATGWKQVNGSWYFLESSGAMAHDTTVDGYTLGSDGAML